MATKVAFYGGPIAHPECREILLNNTPPLVKIEGHPNHHYRYKEDGIAGPEYRWTAAPGTASSAKRVADIEWDDIDWHQSNAAIAKRLGISEATIGRKRKQHTNIPAHRQGTYQKPAADWAGLDWSKSNQQLASLTGTSEGTVRGYRRKHAPETCEANRKNSAHNWAGVDWSKSTMALAIELDMTATYVQSKRRKHDPNYDTEPSTSTRGHNGGGHPRSGSRTR